MRFLVIDGNSIVNRAFYGIKLLTTKDGQFTNGIYGFLNILARLREDCAPDHVAVAFDLRAPTFRHKLYDGYKAGRKGMPPELASQMPLLKEILRDLGYQIVEQEGYEADDILGTLSAQCKGDDKCFLATGDRDALQLVSPQTTVLLAATKMGKAVTTAYTPETLMEEYGLTPPQMIELKAIMGDTSDKIPGVAGIGQKGATDLIQRYGNIDYIYEHLDDLDIKKGVYDKLVAGKDSAYLSRTLGTICRTAPIDVDPDSYVPTNGDIPAAIRLLAKLEMFSIIEKLNLTDAAPQIPTEEAPVFSLKEERDLMGLLGRLKNANEAFFTVQYAGGAPEVLCFAEEHGVTLVEANCLDFRTFLEQFFAASYPKHTANAKALYRFALHNGMEFRGLAMDSELAGYLLNPGANGYDVLRLAGEYALPVPEIEAPESVLDTVKSAAVLPRLCVELFDRLRENEQLSLLQTIELPLCEVLADMENTGFLVDKEAIAAYGETLLEQIDATEKRIYFEAGETFNLNSPKQLGAILFEKLGLPARKKTKSGYSTNAEVLEELAANYPIVADVLEYRMLSKLKSTYCDGLTKEIEADGRIRSTLNQTETRTGRISSLSPNLQNIPVRRKEGREIRRFFVAAPGNVLVDADYSQIELRVLAALSGDEMMCSAFNNGDDIHAITASQVFGLPLEMVTPLLRSRAKAVNFGIVYGIGAFSLAKDIGVTRKEADSYIKGYLQHYSGIAAFMKEEVAAARENGYAQTLFGRRRYLPELTASNKMLQAFGERVAMNMPIQGTAADIIKIAMIHVYQRLKAEQPQAKLIMQVHDELIIECKEEAASAVAAMLREEMENAATLRVKLVCDVHSGKTWFDAK